VHAPASSPSSCLALARPLQCTTPPHTHHASLAPMLAGHQGVHPLRRRFGPKRPQPGAKPAGRLSDGQPPALSLRILACLCALLPGTATQPCNAHVTLAPAAGLGRGRGSDERGGEQQAHLLPGLCVSQACGQGGSSACRGWAR